MGVTENYLDRKTICWLSKDVKVVMQGREGGTLQYVAVAAILSASFPSKTFLPRALSLYSNNIFRPKLFNSIILDIKKKK